MSTKYASKLVAENDIRSIHARTKYNIQTMVSRGELMYININKKPKWITLPFPNMSGRSRNTIRAYGREVLTQNDISQEKSNNDIRFSVRAKELDDKHKALYDKYKAGDENALDEAQVLVDEIASEKGYDEIVNKYKNTPLWRKAPNGKESNLSEKQWVQVRTPSFKKWFGDWETLAEMMIENFDGTVEQAFNYAKNM